MQDSGDGKPMMEVSSWGVRPRLCCRNTWMGGLGCEFISCLSCCMTSRRQVHDLSSCRDHGVSLRLEGQPRHLKLDHPREQQLPAACIKHHEKHLFCWLWSCPEGRLCHYYSSWVLLALGMGKRNHVSAKDSKIPETPSPLFYQIFVFRTDECI